MRNIKIIVMDVDGTLTDGGIYMGNNGEVMKRFDIKDGYAIHDLMPSMGIVPVVITGRRSEIVQKRCEELGIKTVIQGCVDKAGALKTVVNDLGVNLKDVAYIGDDINDLECMKLVGMRACPCDAAEEIKKICEYVCIRPGGHGVVREFVEWVLEQQYSFENNIF